MAMDSSDSSYLLLEKSECVECARHRCKSARPEWKNTSLLGFLSFTCVFLLLILSRYMFLQTFAQEEFAETPCVQKELVPALGSLKCRIIQPDAQSWNNTLYTGRPALESDLAWTELQTVRVVGVMQDEAAHLNISGLKSTHENVATLLGVMHNLHCIRIIRQILYPDYYYPDRTSSWHDKMLVHAGHCLEAIRQSVMCVPDLTPRSVFWEDEERSAIAVNPSAKQTCVDWSSLVTWERKRSNTLEDLWEANPAEEV